MAETPNSPLPEIPQSATPEPAKPDVAAPPVPEDVPAVEPAPAEVAVLEVTAFEAVISEGLGASEEAAPEPPPVGQPSVATTLEVPPLPSGAAGSADAAPGGEWDLLVGKVKDWLERTDLLGQWERLGGPLRGLGILLALLVVLKLYIALLDTLDDLPLLPRLLQLVGLITLLRFSLTRLTRSSERKAILEDWKRRWDAFRGA